jgi:hypothetical protein
MNRFLDLSLSNIPPVGRDLLGRRPNVAPLPLRVILFPNFADAPNVPCGALDRRLRKVASLVVLAGSAAPGLIHIDVIREA